MEIMPDHVHLLLEVHPQFGIHKAIKTIKGKTSRILRQEFPWLKTKLPPPLDKQLFLRYGWRCAAEHCKAIHRESENIAKEVRK